MEAERPRQKSAEGNREVQRKRDITLSKKLAVMLPSLPALPPVSQFLFPRWPITAN